MRVVTAGDAGDVFVGRERETHAIRGLVTTAGGGGALVVTGEAGAGKTALLRRVVADARGARVAVVRGVESEALLPFACVADLVQPLWQHLGELPAVQREALETSLAVRPGAPAGPLAVCSAVLGLLVAAAEREPQVLVVDDLQWVDPPSAQALLFAARRIGPARIALLFGLRAGPDEPAPSDLPVVRLDGLSAAEARALAGRLGVEVSAGVLDQLVEQTGGNPLAVVETLTSAPDAVLRGAAGFDGPYVGPSLRGAWSAAIDGLDDDAVLALSALAAGHAGTPSELAPVLEALGITLADLAPAERRGLVRSRRHRLELRHPLLRAVVRERLPAADHLRIHRALAAATHDDRRAWYRAAAATAPDDAVADDLEAAAGAAAARGAHETASRTWARAAEFRTGPDSSAALLFRAAAAAALAGGFRAALQWCDRALALRSDPAFAADVERVRARSTTWLGRPVRAAGDLVAAAERVAGTDPGRAAVLYAEATLPCAMSGRITDMLRIAAEAERHAGPEPPVAAAASLAATYAIGGDAARARRLIVSAERGAGADPDPHTLFCLAQAHLFVEDHARAGELLTHARHEARRLGSPATLTPTLSASADLGWWTGDWVAAYADGTEALEWADEFGQASGAGYALVGLGRLDAARGDEAGCRARMERTTREITPHGLDCLDIYVPAVLGLLTLGAGRHPQARQHLERADAAARAQGLANPVVVPLWGDLLDARLRTGDRDAAAATVRTAQDSADATGLAYPELVAARGRGMLSSEPPDALAWFARARDVARRCPMPFEHARTLLYEGETLRRLRRPARARGPLHEALVAFERLGARPWAARAEQEMHAAGAPRPRTADGEPVFERLTPQEFQTARTVATGLNNAEAAAALFVSRKTIEAHLSRVYRKLGLRSRSELVRALDDGTPPADR